VLNKRHLIYCVRAYNIPSATCVETPEDEQVMLETYKAIPLQALADPEGSRSLRLQDF
jgi:hypothetical protein